MGLYFKAVVAAGRRINAQHGTGYSGPSVDWALDTDPPRLDVGLVLFVPVDGQRRDRAPYVSLRFELVGVSEVVLSVNGVELWRGNNAADSDLGPAVEQALMADLLTRVKAEQSASPAD